MPWKRAVVLTCALLAILPPVQAVAEQPATVIRNHWSKQCLSTNALDEVLPTQCGTDKSQLWSRMDDPAGPVRTTRIQNSQTGKCIKPKGINAVVTATCDGAPDLWWKVLRDGARFMLRNGGTGRCLVNFRGRIATASCDNESNQEWTTT